MSDTTRETVISDGPWGSYTITTDGCDGKMGAIRLVRKDSDGNEMDEISFANRPDFDFELFMSRVAEEIEDARRFHSGAYSPWENRCQDCNFWCFGWSQRLTPGVSVVYLAIIQIEQKRNYEPGSRLYLSLRELGQMAGVSHRYAATALDTLKSCGLIHLKRGKQGGRAGEIRRVIPIPNEIKEPFDVDR